MRVYLIRRLFLIIPTLLLVTIVVFLLVRFIPGDVIDMLVKEVQEESKASLDIGAAREMMRHTLGLDVPIHIQYARWVINVFQGDLGISIWTQRSITEELLNRFPVSLELGAIGLITALIIAIPVGVYSAIRQDTWGDYGGRTIAILAIALPPFWIGTMVMVYPSLWWGWAPSMEYIPLNKDLPGNLLQFAIPGIIMGMTMSGTAMRMTRTMMLEVLRQDYIRTAWAKGLSERTIILRHALRNALMPVVTIIGVTIPFLIGGAVVLEQIFALPGIGRYLVDALNRRDYPVISGVNLLLAVIVLVVNLLVDLTYAYLDPRIQYD